MGVSATQDRDRTLSQSSSGSSPKGKGPSEARGNHFYIPVRAMGFTSVAEGWGFPSMAIRSSWVTLLRRAWVGGSLSSSDSRARRRRSSFWEDSWSWAWAYRGDAGRDSHEVRVEGTGYAVGFLTATPHRQQAVSAGHHCRVERDKQSCKKSRVPADTA